ncbi:hypothetical protein TYRP_012016 [Tyrophagus putrescentiae]|nr:hypothetical protein TYRP_012016 [Tyrophagus putrescentiae]
MRDKGVPTLPTTSTTAIATTTTVTSSTTTTSSITSSVSSAGDSGHEMALATLLQGISPETSFTLKTSLPVHPEDESNELAAILEREWKKETLSGTDPKKARFRRALYRTFVRRFVPIVLSFLFQELVIRVGQAYLLGIIIDYLGSGSHSTSGGGP